MKRDVAISAPYLYNSIAVLLLPLFDFNFVSEYRSHAGALLHITNTKLTLFSF